MELTVVEYEKHDHIAHVKLNRPDKLNAMNDAMHQELGLVWIDFRKDKDLRVGQRVSLQTNSFECKTRVAHTFNSASKKRL